MDVIEEFVDALFVERNKEPEMYRGDFDKGVDSYFKAALNARYKLGEALAAEINENTREFTAREYPVPAEDDPQGLHMAYGIASYISGITASLRLSTERGLDVNDHNTIRRAYLDRILPE